jgi:hypothetical protein
MIEKIIKIIQDGLPVDIYFKISFDNQIDKCVLYYPCFLITELDEKNNMFSGYTIQDRNLNSNRKILTSGDIRLICKLDSHYLN